MFKASLLIAVICTAVVACASTPQPAPKTASSVPPGCVASGSRITPSTTGTTGCTAFGRSYSNEDIRRTGEDDVGKAIALLDPTITVHH